MKTYVNFLVLFNLAWAGAGAALRIHFNPFLIECRPTIPNIEFVTLLHQKLVFLLELGRQYRVKLQRKFIKFKFAQKCRPKSVTPFAAYFLL